METELDVARQIVSQYRGELFFHGGIIDRRITDMRALTVRPAFITRVIEDMEANHKSATYVRDFKQQCRDYIEPRIGDMTASEVYAG